MHPAEKRLKELKELLKAEPEGSMYAADLKLTIAQVKKQIKNKTIEGYQMVEV